MIRQPPTVHHDWRALARQLMASMPGKMNEQAMAYLGELVAMAPDGLLVDLGTYWGRSAMMMARVAERVRRKYRVLSIDNYQEGPDAKAGGGPYPDVWTVQRYFVGMPDVYLHVGYTTPAPLMCAYEPIALVLVDADHYDDAVRRDALTYKQLMVPSGIMAFDDYGNPRWPDVQPVVDELMTGWERLGVRGSLAAFRRGE